VPAFRRLSAAFLLLALVFHAACSGPTPLDTILDRGETLRVRGAPPTTLDPSVAGDSTSWTYLLQVHSGLVRLDDKLQIVPDLAERWDLSPDGRRYEFHLRPGVKFHSGRDVRSEDFKYAMERALDPATKSNTAKQYLGDIVGAADVMAGKTTDLRGVQVVDPTTLAIEIDEPKSYFLAKLTYPTAFALDRANVESGAGWFEQPNGTGPFKLTAWERGNKLTLTRFTQHWTGPAKLKTIEFNLSPIPGIVLYERGDVDVAEVDVSSLERVRDPANPLHTQLVETPILSTWYVGFNVKTPPFDDPAVRRAFAMATDRDRMVDIYFKGTRGKATTILPPGLPGRTNDVRPPAFDVNQARQTLARSRYGQQLPEIIISVGEGGGSTGEALATMYSRNLGIDVGVREHRDNFFAALERHEPQMFFTGWIADYPDAEDFLDILFHSGSQANYGSYSLPDFDKLLEQARVVTDPAARAELYRQAEQKLLDDGGAIPIHHEVIHALVGPHVTGLTWTPLGVLSYHDVEVGQRPARRAA
jgi:oligopeptide transport system substrate-binding protein